jgi:N-acetylneuraminate synthase
MPYKMIPELSDFCKKENINFMSTPFSVEDAKQIDQFVAIHKVASYEINHIRLLEFLATTGKPILLSTGASTYDEIDFAVKLLQKKNVKKIGILQCTAKYPADIKILNLNVISNFKKKYQLPVGFSDHSLDPIIGPIMAVGLGATFIEKHFTLNKNLPGPDHSFALEPNDLELMIKTIRDADLAKGSGKKEILKDEQELHRFATRSIQAIKSIKKGDIFQEGINFEILRPGEQIRGLDARFLAKIEGKKALNDIDVGNGITDSI